MSLNAAQRDAVEHVDGPMLVLAGAGSGKTRVITHRIARLIERGVRPEQILGVTFTNKAAGEMTERMVKLIGKDRANQVQLSTFHSFGVRFLQEESKALGFIGRFVIFDQGDSMGLIREIMRSERKAADGRKLDAAAVLARISKWKNDFILPDQVVAAHAGNPDFEYDAISLEVYPRYESGLRAMCAVDFDDLVLQPVNILRKREDIRKKWRTRFRYLLIDEFQDTSKSQLELVKQLTNEFGNVCVVGDDDQSIYAWRGAEVKNILEFDTHFPGTKIVALVDNYRSREAIIEVANAAIGQSKEKRHGKVLRAARGAGDRVRLSVLEDPEQEARFVGAEIKTLIEQGKKARDVAILYRSNLQARVIEEELRGRGIPYRLFGGTQFFDRKEVKDAAAYLRTIVQPRDEISLRRVINYPARGIGETTVERLEKHALARDLTFADAIANVASINDIPDAAKRGVKAFQTSIDTARQRFERGDKLAATARALFEEVGLFTELVSAAEGGEAGRRRVGNIEYLLGAIDRYEKNESKEKPSLASFLARITMRMETENEEAEANAVTLSTLHAAKGLEFPVVFLIGVVEGQLPHSRTTDPKVTDVVGADVEEERRLFYVAVTRAMDRLYITRPKRKVLRGKPTVLVPSRFLEGLPEEHLEEYARKVSAFMSPEEIAELGRQFLETLK